MMRLIAIALGLLSFSGCYTPHVNSVEPFKGSVVGFSHAQASPGKYRVMYVGRWGATWKGIRRALEHEVRELCNGQYKIEGVEETVTVVSHTETKGGWSMKAVASCQ